MKERNVVRCLFGVGFLCIATIACAFVLMNQIRRERPKFVEPVIWRVPYTGGAPRIQPDI